MHHIFTRRPWRRALRDWLITLGLLLLGYGLSNLLLLADPGGGFVSMIFVLMVVLTARLTEGYACGVAASFVGVICVNYVFTFPYWEFNFTISGYPLTFLTMLSVSLIVSALTSQNKRQEHLRMENERETMRANLLRAVSHDLRTPLTGIIGASSSYLENGDLLPENEKTAILAHIHEDANWLLNMVENLLAVTRIHDQSSTVKKTDESVEEIVSAAILRLKKRLPEATVTVAVPDELLIIPMDAILIEQVLINLLENAIVHSQSTEPVLCYVDDDAATVTFHVKDYGIGIDPERITNIFDGNSYIGNKESDSNKGMGIGLSICKTILTAHGGTINAQNHAQGAEFYFSLPKELK